jgi:hypothetical protein
MAPLLTKGEGKMKVRLIAVVLAAVLTTAGVMAFSGHSPSSSTTEESLAARKSAAVQPEGDTGAYLDDFKAGYADGFGSGALSFNFPDQSSMASNTRGYLDGFTQGYGDGGEQRPNLRSELCTNARVSESTGAQSGYSAAPRYATPNRIASQPAANRYYDSRSYAQKPIERGISSTTRKAILIGGGAALGAGLGGAVGGKKGALVGALVGGGGGTALALSKNPSRAFNRRVSGKSMVVNTLLGAGAGAGIGALAGGKRGALAGAGLGGGGGAIYTLVTGKRVRP